MFVFFSECFSSPFLFFIFILLYQFDAIHAPRLAPVTI